MEHASPPLDLRAQTSSVSWGTQKTAQALQVYTHPFQCKTTEAPHHQELGPWTSRKQQQQEAGCSQHLSWAPRTESLTIFTA